MSEFTFERAAMRGESLPAGLDVADSCLYMALRYLYAMFYKGLISRDGARREKEKMVYNWTTDKSKLEFLNRESEALRERIGLAADEYRKNPTLENADRLYAALYNMSDNWRIKNNFQEVCNED